MTEERDIEQMAAEAEQPAFVVIDDNRFVNAMLCDLLKQYGRVTGIYDGYELMSLYEAITPDIVFLDIHLPDISGFDLIDKIRARDPDSYIVMITGDVSRFRSIRTDSRF